MIRVLLYALRGSDFTEMLRAARALQATGRFRARVVLDSLQIASTEAAGFAERCEEAGVEFRSVMEQRSVPSGSRRGPPMLRHWRRPAFGWIPPRIRGFAHTVLITASLLLRTAPSLVLGYRKRLRSYRELVARFGAQIIILPEDIVGMFSPLMIRAGHDEGIPSLIVPYTIANREEAAESLSTQPSYNCRRPDNFIAALLFPKWVLRHRDQRLIRLPSVHIFGQYLTRTVPPDPWMMNSGFANAIAVENEAMKEYWLEAGLPEWKLRPVGAFYDDPIAAALREKDLRRKRLYERHGLPERPLLLVGLPPNQLTTNRPNAEFDDFDTLLRRLATALRQSLATHNVMVRAHPNFPDAAKVFGEFGIATSDEDTAELIPLADIYIASASATIRWAIACGIPTLNYDVFRYGFSDFEQVPGVETVSDIDTFTRSLLALTRSRELWEARRAAVQGAMHRWGRLDGRSTERIVALIEELIAKKPAPRIAG